MTVAVALLAAGSSSRMGAGRHKLLARFGDTPLIRRSALAALDSGGTPVIIVLGHRADELRAPIANLPATVVINRQFGDGLSSSLKAAVTHVPASAGGLLVHLADMPAITAADLKRLIDAFDGNAVVRATSGGRRGNPVILPRALFAGIAELEGDVGARQLIADSGLPVIDIDLGAAAAIDVDTPEALQRAGGVWTKD
ncbi:nucleotidyltransferase family protein [Pseudochelatococcus sp. B33]